MMRIIMVALPNCQNTTKEIVVIPGEADEYGRILVRTMNTFLLIPEEEILDLGFN